MPLASTEVEEGAREPAAVPDRSRPNPAMPCGAGQQQALAAGQVASVLEVLRLPAEAALLPPDTEAGACPREPEAAVAAKPETHKCKSKVLRGSKSAQIIADYMSAGPLAKKQKPAEVIACEPR